MQVVLVVCLCKAALSSRLQGLQGLGLDWGVAFTQGWAGDQSSSQSEPSAAPQPLKSLQPVACSFAVQERVSQSGWCSAWDSCMVGRTSHLGWGCQGRPGVECTVELVQWRQLNGTCTNGHCMASEKLPRSHHPTLQGGHQDQIRLARRSGQVRLHHEVCAKTVVTANIGEHRVNHTQLDQNKISRQHTRQSSQLVSSPSSGSSSGSSTSSSSSSSSSSNFNPSSRTSCRGLYNPSAYQQLTMVCRDCYNLLREPGAYSLCTADCFATPFFLTCTKALLLEVANMKRLASTLG